MKFKTVYVCSNCGQSYSKWQGQCPNCGSWNSLVEEVIQEESKKEKNNRSLTDFSSEVVTLDKSYEFKTDKISTGITELNRVLGDGIMRGQVILLAGPPGIGKSTLMLETANKIGKENQKVLYISGEESLEQVSSRAIRLNIKNNNVYLMSETNLLRISEEVKKIKPVLIIIDSIQTVYHPELSSVSGSITQIKECAGELLKLAKQNSIALFILGHITKEGDLAGPKILEHMVDTVLYFDSEKNGFYRLLRAGKNRFGPIEELGIFEMTEKGLLCSENYFSMNIKGDEKIAGRARTILFEGTRPIVSQIEALVNKTFYPYPRRIFTGIDTSKGQILLAAIEKNVSLRFDNFDVFASIHGGLKTKDMGLDLAFCTAVISSLKEIPLPDDWAFIGEVGILARTSSPSYLTKRIQEAVRLGFKKIFIPSSFKEKINSKIEIVKIEDLKNLSYLISGK